MPVGWSPWIPYQSQRQYQRQTHWGNEAGRIRGQQLRGKQNDAANYVSDKSSDSGTANQLDVNLFQVVIEQPLPENIPSINDNFRDLNELFTDISPDVLGNIVKIDISIDPDEDVPELDVPFYVDLSELVLLGQDDEDLHNLGIINHSDTEKEAHNWIGTSTEEKLHDIFE